MSEDLDRFLRLPSSKRKKFFADLGFYTYALCEIDDDNKRTPFYIGKGKNERCFSHIDDKNLSEKTKKIHDLYENKKLGIDILAHNLTEKESLVAESVCIDLLNIENLTNLVRGHGDNTKRLPIGDLASLIENEEVDVLPEHRGAAFLLEKTYLHNFGDLQLLEFTRGIWRRKQPEEVRYAYATYRGIVKEVYEIYTWVPAGTQQYFTRALDPEKIGRRFEFVGKKASPEVRDLYLGKIIKKKRSYGDPYVKVGFD